MMEGVIKELADTPDCVKSNKPPLGESYQLNVPVLPADAPSVADGFPQVLPPVTVIVGIVDIVATTAALLVVHTPLSNST